MWDGGHEEHLREEGLEGEHSSMQQSEVSGGSDLSPEDLPLQALVSPQKAGMCSNPDEGGGSGQKDGREMEAGPGQELPGSPWPMARPDLICLELCTHHLHVHMGVSA